MPLTTLDDVKAWLTTSGETPVDTDDALLTRLIDAASGAIEAWCNRAFAATTYTETMPGSGSARLLLPNYPVTAVSALSVAGVAWQPSAGYGQTGYAFDEIGLYLIGGVFPRVPQAVTVTYTAGYATTPGEIAQACIELVAHKYRERDRIGTASKGLAGESTAYVITDFPKSVRTLMQNYRKVVPL